MRPAVARLVVQRPIGLGNGTGLDQAVRRRINGIAPVAALSRL